MEPCVTSIIGFWDVKVPGRSPSAVCWGAAAAGTRTSRATASTGVKTPLQVKVIREAMDPTLSTHAQPAAPRCLLGPGAPQALTRSASVSFLG